MKRSLIVPVLMSALAACGGEREQTGQCPTGEVCSPQTPEGLDFIGNATADAINLAGPLPTAVGGTQDVLLTFGGIPDEDFDLPYIANDDTANAFVVEGTNGPNVTIRGVAAGENYLRIVDPSGGLYDRKELSSAEVASATIFVAGLPQPTARPPFAFASGDLTLAIALSSAVGPNGEPPTRLIDTSATVDSVAGLAQPGWEWDVLTGTLTAGTYPLAVTTGGVRFAVPLTIVDGADAIALADGQAAVIAGQVDEVCFAATNTGRTVLGLTWRFTVSGDPTQGTTVMPDESFPSCAYVVLGSSTTAPITVTATAGGATFTQVFQLGESLRVVPTRPTRTAPRTTGERAELNAVVDPS